MASVDEHFGMAYPYFAEEDDALFVPVEVRDWAKAVAVEFRPSCLSVEMQNLAQAHYMAYLIASRFVAGVAFGSVAFSESWGQVIQQALNNRENQAAQQAMSEAMGRSVTGPTTERQEGQVRTRFAEGGSSVTEALSKSFGSAWGYGVGSSSSTGGSGSKGGSASSRGGVPGIGPTGPYDAWVALAARCGPVPGVDTGTGTAATATRGGILIRTNPRLVC